MKKPKITRTIWAIAAALAAVFWLRCGPLPPGLLDEGEDVSTTVVDRHGIPLYEARSKDGTRVVRLAPDALPANVVSATIAAEDRRFFSHVGVDPIAITRAMMQNAKAGRVVEGGSTITQQVVKLLLARDRLKSQRPEDPSRPSGRDIGTKLREAILALRLEHRLSKSEILALYLSLAPYGNQIVGVERASRAYFGSSADHLTVAQAAFLAGLPQRPSAFNPYRELRPALARHNQVIKRMASLDRITAATAKESLAEHLVLTRDESSFVAPHFVEMVLASFETVRLQADTTTVGRPSRIETTLDVELQRKVEGIISSQRAILNRHRAHNVAVVVLHNATGEWLAWEGSGNYFDAENGGAINGALALRQPGSALKPFTYALAFEERETPASVLPDVPSHFPTAEEGDRKSVV